MVCPKTENWFFDNCQNSNSLSLSLWHPRGILRSTYQKVEQPSGLSLSFPRKIWYSENRKKENLFFDFGREGLRNYGTVRYSTVQYGTSLLFMYQYFSFPYTDKNLSISCSLFMSAMCWRNQRTWRSVQGIF